MKIHVKNKPFSGCSWSKELDWEEVQELPGGNVPFVDRNVGYLDI